MIEPRITGEYALRNASGYLLTEGTLFSPCSRLYASNRSCISLLVEINRGDGDLDVVLRDVLGLTKVNYNSCDYASGLPVTLKFADRVGEILLASPRGCEAPPLSFRFYI